MVDVVVIGAGAAGIGAGRGLSQLGIKHVILEAKQRVGGRAFSDTSSLGWLWDHGCHWLHSADINVLRGMADKLGHDYVRQPSRFCHHSFLNGQWLTENMEEAFVWNTLGRIAEAGRSGPDVSAASLLDSSHPQQAQARHWCELMYSQDPEDVSVGDAGAYRDTGLNLGVGDGYGALIAKLAAGLPVHLNTAASLVRVTAAGVEVETSAGTLTAKACIVAVSARILETGRLRFEPGLASSITEAVTYIPMGYYEKIALSFNRQVFDIRHADVCDVADGSTPINFELHPHGRLIAIGHIAGTAARELAEQGKAAMLDFGTNALVAAFGADIRKEVAGGAVTSWTDDPWIGGAYSCAKPGMAHLRENFGEAIAGRVFLAGEHVHRHFMATAHGAYETGLAAAAKAARVIGHADPVIDPLWLAA